MPSTTDRAEIVARLASQTTSSTAARDAEIRAWRAEGGSLREIAKAAGMSHGGIARICAEAEQS